MEKTPSYGLSDDVSPSGSVGSATEAINDFANLSFEEQEQQREIWKQELTRVEEEINTLRTVLSSKIHHATELKRKLGITVWKEITEDVSSGLKNVRESNVYQTVESKVDNIKSAVVETPIYHKTESVIKTTAEKTSSLFSGFTNKLSQMKNSESFKSFEGKVGGAYESVKTKVSTSRSGSVQSFNDIASSTNNTAPTTPIHEEKPIA
ncbi:hypothetical protein PVAND_008047 [Polypedilum vanderplanki]|uniref:Tumor protein D54 n=1 Tax=Polypedilum vanderplanki TaxID=319348 RepID=A0A9J6C8V7_POLVA|nr:hypothetical protein PVAND_008047 [Polypedilum vanderplanki]